MVHVGQEVTVARQGGVRGVVVETRPGQVLVRLETGESSWVPDNLVRRRGFSIRPSRPAPAMTAARVDPANPYSPPTAPGTAWQQSGEVSLWHWLFSFEGRIGRGRYWGGIAVLYGFILVLGIGAALVIYAIQKSVLAERAALPTPPPPEPSASPAVALIAVVAMVLLYLPFLWSVMALAVKRWHDRDKSGWWILIGLVPLIGGVWAFVETGCLAGTRGPNRFGPDPLS